LTTQFTGYAPILDENVILIGARDLDVAEGELLLRSAIKHISPANTRELEEALKVLSKRVQNLYVHVDMDVLDESEGRVNSYACRGGLSSSDLYAALESIRAAGGTKVASITAYDPSCDPGGKVRSIIFEVAKQLAG
jgi:arginase